MCDTSRCSASQKAVALPNKVTGGCKVPFNDQTAVEAARAELSRPPFHFKPTDIKTDGILNSHIRFLPFLDDMS